MLYALVDADSFYSSAEQVFRPDWRGKPLIVLSNNDGCVVAANRQAKEAGVPKFQPYFKIKALCESKGVITCSSNYELYADLSDKMMQVIGRFAPEQHIYSIDESILRYKSCDKTISNFYDQGIAIRKAVWKECRLPVCVGFGESITLAKAANRAAKNNKSSLGVCVIDNEPTRISVLSSLDIEDVWGVGKKLSTKLRLIGIDTAYKLSLLSPTAAKNQFGITMERTVRELNGQSCISWETGRTDKQQIFSTRSLGQRVMDLDSLQQALINHAGIAARKARQQQSLCRVMMCFASSSAFSSNPVSFKSVYRFPFPTNDTKIINRVVSKIAEQLYREGVPYQKVGIGLIELTTAKHAQQDLFNTSSDDSRLMNVLDGINNKYGNDTLLFAAQGVKQQWKMKREMLTPRYTTSWFDIPKVQC